MHTAKANTDRLGPGEAAGDLGGRESGEASTNSPETAEQPSSRLPRFPTR